MGNKIRPVVNLEMDNAGVDGYIEPGNFHRGNNWTFHQDITEYTKDIGENWSYVGVERIKSLKCIAPLNTVTFSNMLKTKWQHYDYNDDSWSDIDDDSDWTQTKPAYTKERVNFLHYFKAVAGQRGMVRSKEYYAPRLHFKIIRYHAVENETEQTSILIHLMCDEEGSGISDYYYVLEIPIESGTADTQKRYPALYYYYKEDGVFKYTLLSLFRGFNIGNDEYVFDVRMERLIKGKYILIKFSNTDEEWLVELPHYIYNDDNLLKKGRIGIESIGQMMMVNVQEMDILGSVTDDSGNKDPYVDSSIWKQFPTVFYTDEDNPTKSIIKAVYSKGYGYVEAPIAGEPDILAEDNINVTFTISEATVHIRTKPTISMVKNSDISKTKRLERNLLFYISENWPATVTTTTSTSIDIKPESISWHRDNSWRNASFTANFKDFDDTKDLKTNQIANFSLYWDGEDFPSDSDRIRGYLDGSHRIRSGDKYYGEAVPTIKANDYISARLKDKVFYGMGLASLSTFSVHDAFEMIIKACGIYDLMFIDLTGQTTEEPTKPYESEQIGLKANDPYDEDDWDFDDNNGFLSWYDCNFPP